MKIFPATICSTSTSSFPTSYTECFRPSQALIVSKCNFEKNKNKQKSNIPTSLCSLINSGLCLEHLI